MIRILILVMAGAIALALAYFSFNSIPRAKKMAIVGGGLMAAVLAVLLQGSYPVYMPFLAMAGAALLASLVYMKIAEKQQQEKQRQAKERKARVTAAALPKEKPQNETASSFRMDSIEAGKGERKLG